MTTPAQVNQVLSLLSDCPDGATHGTLTTVHGVSDDTLERMQRWCLITRRDDKMGNPRGMIRRRYFLGVNTCRKR